jgi:hypothetical protein
MEDKQGIKDESKEVDFEPLIAWFLKQMQRVSNGLNFMVSAIAHHSTLVMVCILLGAATGAGTYFFAPKKYLSHLQLVTKDTDNQTNKNLVEQLGKLADDKSFGSLAQELKIDRELAKEISDFKYLDHTNSEISAEDTVVEDRNFFVEIETYNIELLPTYQEAIINWIENQPYTAEQRTKRSNIIEAKIVQLNKELIRLDSLKQIVARSIEPRGKAEGLVFGEPINPVAVYEQYNETYDQLLYSNEELKTLKSVKVVNGFIANEKPLFPRLRHIAFITLGGLVL